jgi:hypothetical protein
MKISRATIKDILSNSAVFCLLINVVSVVYFIAHNVEEPMLWALVVPFLLMYVIRKRAKTRLMFVVLHILLIAVAGLIIGNRESQWFVWIFLGATGLFSLYLKPRDEISLGRIFNTVLFITTFCLFFLLNFLSSNPVRMQMQLVVTLLAALALYILFTHMDNMDYHLNVLTKVNGYRGPSAKVVAANNKLIGFFIGGVAGVSVLVLFGGGLWRLAMAAQQWFGRRLGEVMTAFWDAQPLATDSGLDIFEEDIYVEPATDFFQMVADALAEHDQEAVFNTFHGIVDIIAFIVVALIVFLVVRQFIKHFYQKRKTAASDQSTDTVIALEGGALSDLLDLLPRFSYRHLHPLRRAYVKKVNKHIKYGVGIQNADTTDIVADKIRAAENIDELTTKYEKVRYGP